ncbi:hypothetical protein BDN67DRAFT_1015835 [Paxillus ammoniavirescens]|nr:hypothetical protein BDN67DRAFT_1015835 [Paxillus ammoniavirescens]
MVETAPVLALKTYFNTAWDNFDIHKLSEAILQPLKLVCAEWMDREGLGSEATPLTDDWYHRLDLALYPLPFLEEFTRKEGLHQSPSLAKDVVWEDGSQMRYWLFDFSTAIFGNSQWLVSRKRNANLGDLTRKWNKLSLSDVPVILYEEEVDREIEIHLQEQRESAQQMIDAQKLLSYSLHNFDNPKTVGYVQHDDVRSFLKSHGVPYSSDPNDETVDPNSLDEFGVVVNQHRD